MKGDKMSKSKRPLPTAAELMAAANEGRLMEVVMPTGVKLGDLPPPPDLVSLETITPFGKRFGDHTREEVVQLGDFYSALAQAIEIHGRPRLIQGGKR